LPELGTSNGVREETALQELEESENNSNKFFKQLLKTIGLLDLGIFLICGIASWKDKQTHKKREGKGCSWF
jgi:hypothetical protein